MGKQNNIVKFGVPGGFSYVPGCSGVPVFRGVRAFGCSAVPGFITCQL